jgi:hypothetical protein
LQSDFDRVDLRRAEDYMREHPGCSWPEARDWAISQRPENRNRR